MIILAEQNTGMYQLGCEASPHRQKIDAWINEGKTNKWISEQLRELDGYISPTSISKYRKHRDEVIIKELEETPEFQAKQMMVTEQFNQSVAKIQKVDLIGRLSGLIEDSAELLADAKARDIQINSIKDMRMVQQTMLDAISVYGETMLNAQKYDEINNNPSLLQNNNTTININIKSALTDILKGAMEDGANGYAIIDKLRSGIVGTNRE
jgi:hypothetical protein|nr:MAG TPA: hypothetical protein [Caudoviricetes sp.]